jgi:hypothetical protein
MATSRHAEALELETLSTGRSAVRTDGAIMLNTYAGLWPQMAANSTEADTADPWGMGTLIETQARLWNHLLDANRSFWEFYAPWLSAGPSLWNVALAPAAQAEAVAEPEQSVNGVPDAFEAQARSWNHFLDANRNFWTAFAWQVPAASWLNGAAAVQAADEEAAESPKPARTPARKPATGVRRPRSG